MRTGYFANAETRGTQYRTKVHITIQSPTRGIIPLCNTKMNDLYFQLASNGVHLDYVECKMCLRIYHQKVGRVLDARSRKD